MLQASEGLFYYVPGEEAWQSLSAHARQISIVAPQVFLISPSGAVSGSVEEKVRSLAARQRLGLMPLLYNENFNTELASRVLNQPLLRATVIAEALRLCQENGCTGLQLDLEGVADSDRQAYTGFVRQAAEAFHAARLQFSVALPSPLFPGPRPLQHYRTVFGGFPVASTPYDLAAIAPFVDFITLMTYDDYTRGSAPGPIAGYTWVEQSVRYALQYVPRQKLHLGLGFYGRVWCNQDAGEARYDEVMKMLAENHAQLRWHEWHRSPWFVFKDNKCPGQNVVFFENRQSLREKMKLVGKYGLRGYSAWRLGQEDPRFWR